MNSSCIASFDYSPYGGVLNIEFQSGSVYRCEQVPLHVYLGFVRAYSKGEYYNEYIRGKYPCRRVV